MDILINCPKVLYTLRSLFYSRERLIQRPTTDQQAENKRLRSAQLSMGQLDYKVSSQGTGVITEKSKRTVRARDDETAPA